MKLIRIALTCILAIATTSAAFARSSSSSAPDPRLGAWREIGGTRALLLEENRAGWFDGAQPRFFRATFNDAGATLESWGRHTTFNLRLKDGQLHVVTPDAELMMQRLEQTPEVLLVTPYPLPEHIELNDSMVSFLQGDLRQRRIEDQRVRLNIGPGTDMSEMQTVDADNTEFLRNIIAEAGWIDVERFGVEASDAAFLIVQHTGDIRLMRTALPLIEADVLAKRLDGQNYALLFDRLQLRLGYLQRYGSQLTTIDDASLLMPCEDIERVDQFRAEMGMTLLGKYLEFFQDDGTPSVRHLGEGQYEAEVGR
ncbi:MAG: hypothetical protein ACI8TQ_002569 [Planctomycetota bacterium]|jgi:hypothetical protein